MTLTVNDVQKLEPKALLSRADPAVRAAMGEFLKEFNRREVWVRHDKNGSFDEYAGSSAYKHKEEFGFGFSVGGRAVPYFHPARASHDEIIWLNNNLYYDPGVSFDDRLVNSAIVKFYGPSRTLDIITGSADDLRYLTPTGKRHVDMDLLKNDMDYRYTIMRNVELAFANKQQIWGTTELRTSLQTSSRNLSRSEGTIIDSLGVKCPFTNKTLVESSQVSPDRKMRPSDMIHWINHLAFSHDDQMGWIDFYKSKPDMKESFDFLTKTRGIGNYYGYHFSSNLARMPGVGSKELIEVHWKKEFTILQDHDKMLSHGNLDENADYVVAGPGAMATLKRLWPDLPINEKLSTKLLVDIRDHQEWFFGIEGDSQAERDLKLATELGRFTTFGCEISCCQFDVFTRAKDNKSVASNRANAPISKETGNTASNLMEYL